MADEPLLAVDEIQGNLLPGFGTAALELIGAKIVDAAAARAVLARLAPRVTSLRQANSLRDVRRTRLAMNLPRNGVDELLLNVAFAATALPLLGLPGANIPEDRFLVGMANTDLQDPRDAGGNPVGWAVGSRPDNSPDLLFILASDSAPHLRAGAEALDQLLAANGCRVVYSDHGGRLPNNEEHFGFRDDISQPGVHGRVGSGAEQFLTRRRFAPADPRAAEFARPGQPLVWPGQFLYGYPTLLDDPLLPGPEAVPPHEWMRNGSYLVFRRLRQDVLAFRAFVADGAAQATARLGRAVPETEFAGWVVGRWPDGTPLDRSPGGPNPAVAADDDQVNFFAYGTDEPDAEVVDGSQSRVVPGCPADLFARRCPHFAHVRKVNPRGATDQGPAAAFRMLRRGIPYGPPWQPGEAADIDRGLLFLAYMRSPSRQFMTVNGTWANTAAAPEGNGHDLLIGQSQLGPRTADRFEGTAAADLSFAGPNGWVVPTGGGFYFAPARSVLQQLDAPAVV